MTLSRCEEIECQPHERRDVIEAAWPRCPEERFEFRERELDRVEVRTVRRQKSELCTRGLNRRANGRLFVRRQIIEDHHVAATQGRREDLFDIRQEARAIDRVIEDRGCRQAVDAERRDHGVHLPLAARRVIAEPRAAGTPTVAAQQVGRDPAFIEKHVLRGVVDRLPVAPPPALSGDVGPALFVGVNRFF